MRALLISGVGCHMKLLALNIQHGGGKRVFAIVRYLIRQQPDVVVLTEFRENANAQVIREGLGEAGFQYFVTPEVAPRQNSVSLCSRLPFEAAACAALPQPDRHRLVMGRFEEMFIAGVYFAQREAKASLFKFLAEQGYSGRSEPYFIVGDFNTGLHYKDEQGATFACADEFEQLSNLGYHDSWRKRHPAERVFSWYSARSNGFRIDHVFTNIAADAMITRAYYDHEPRNERLTDHSALVVEVAANLSSRRTVIPLRGLSAA